MLGIQAYRKDEYPKIKKRRRDRKLAAISTRWNVLGSDVVKHVWQVRNRGAGQSEKSQSFFCGSCLLKKLLCWDSGGTWVSWQRWLTREITCYFRCKCFERYPFGKHGKEFPMTKGWHKLDVLLFLPAKWKWNCKCNKFLRRFKNNAVFTPFSSHCGGYTYIWYYSGLYSSPKI